MSASFDQPSASPFRSLPNYPGLCGEEENYCDTLRKRREPLVFYVLVALAFGLLLLFALGPILVFVYIFST
jgi:hypothetical protein